eukprot:jgi/Psemu1/28326/gm1.28326_g
METPEWVRVQASKVSARQLSNKNPRVNAYGMEWHDSMECHGKYLGKDGVEAAVLMTGGEVGAKREVYSPDCILADCGLCHDVGFCTEGIGRDGRDNSKYGGRPVIRVHKEVAQQQAHDNFVVRKIEFRPSEKAAEDAKNDGVDLDKTVISMWRFVALEAKLGDN